MASCRAAGRQRLNILELIGLHQCMNNSFFIHRFIYLSFTFSAGFPAHAQEGDLAWRYLASQKVRPINMAKSETLGQGRAICPWMIMALHEAGPR